MALATDTPEKKAKDQAYRRAWAKANRDKTRKYGTDYCRRHKGAIKQRASDKAVAPDKPDVYKCKDCKTVKPFELSHFQKRDANKWKLSYQCRDCSALVSHRYITRKKYNISLEEARMLRDTACHICGKEGKLHIDHDHKTGKVRGPLCQGCNHALGNMEDDPVRLRKAADYLERHRG